MSDRAFGRPVMWRGERQQTPGIDRLWVLDDQDLLVGFCDVVSGAVVGCPPGLQPWVHGFALQWLTDAGVWAAPATPRHAVEPAIEPRHEGPGFDSARVAPARPFNVPDSARQPITLSGPSMAGVRVETVGTQRPEDAEVSSFIGRMFRPKQRG